MAKIEKKRERFNMDSSLPESPPMKKSRETERISDDVHELNQVNSLESSNSMNSVLDWHDLEHMADLLNMFDVPDSSDGEVPGLESVVKSLEEEIISTQATEDKTSSSEDAMVKLVYLLEASDDELGLPPRFMASPSNGEEVVLEPIEYDVGEVYDSFDFGISGCGGWMDDVELDGFCFDVVEDTKLT
ncbi:hypothetical protein ISN45_Aa01g032940 [Arabidopsis thaliana x Arabidopsis arenosa]|uniref:Uncharacterized protein n=1 Tax=Arabidopsis thaliana x Arabidopsis arenosa TaxID=1240361 RepID=A0A8T2C8X2_9BRAS|nr:hypothetical protein ISN45_Aa01g032940 [Arabidopsis thaliana x Arabidopsis arenosa]